MTQTTLKLGTRRSLLAKTQSKWVAEQLRMLHSRAGHNLEIEFVEIETEGDRILYLPLQKVEGKEFFVKELNQALLDKRIDFAVHSLKDLSVGRPSGLVIGAIPPRENPRDIIVFRGDIMDRILTGI